MAYKNKGETDPKYRLDMIMKTAIWLALKGKKAGRT
jgi:hypothetical protein